MFSIAKCSIPAGALLEKYATNGGYVDCYITELPGRATLPQYIFAFYTTWLFKLERAILKITIAKPSTDVQAGYLAEGRSEYFAAWYVEERDDDELLMSDFSGRTRSWLCLKPANAGDDVRTQLYFGSAVVPRRDPRSGEISLGPIFQALLGFHKVYSKLLLSAARARLTSQVLNNDRMNEERRKEIE